MQHNYQDLIDIFHRDFYQQYNTKLVKGQDEPIYLPANVSCSYHQIVFAHGFFRSALHELAHWSIAGEERQLKEDWGYWYIPDGRNQKQQARFEQVEVKPQAVEWAFSLACNIKFDVSADNLSGCGSDSEHFKEKVYQQVLHYFQQGFPVKAQLLITALMAFYRPNELWSESLFLSEYRLYETV